MADVSLGRRTRNFRDCPCTAWGQQLVTGLVFGLAQICPKSLFSLSGTYRIASHKSIEPMWANEKIMRISLNLNGALHQLRHWYESLKKKNIIRVKLYLVLTQHTLSFNENISLLFLGIFSFSSFSSSEKEWGQGSENGNGRGGKAFTWALDLDLYRANRTVAKIRWSRYGKAADRIYTEIPLCRWCSRRKGILVWLLSDSFEPVK